MAEMEPYTQEPASTSPGAILKRCREFHAISLEEASETTKIGVSYLRALEEDQITEFANLVYLKGFLRIYAAYLGLNADDVARMYDKQYGSPDAADQGSRSKLTENVRPVDRLAFLKKLTLPAVLLAAILIVSIFFKPPPPSKAPSSPAAPPSAAPVAVPHLDAAVQTLQSSGRLKRADRKPEPATKEPAPAAPSAVEQPSVKKSPENSAGFILKIKVILNGTLTAAVDGSGGHTYELTAGDVIEWKAERSVALELSNAGGVEIEINGKPYRSIGPAGKQLYIEFDADGIKQ
ncbi:MAG TPA: DUF4115 domain-containing protein [Desulfuromonadales bacterium]|nr:DUF4115 domain-containing protein [Desulfuromonadales bacterium]